MSDFENLSEEQDIDLTSSEEDDNAPRAKKSKEDVAEIWEGEKELLRVFENLSPL